MKFLNLLGIICLISLCAHSQTPDATNYNYGIWQTFGDPISPSVQPEVNGRLCNFRWKDIETAPNVWNWNQFDSNLAKRAKDGLPVIFMVYTEEDAPEWLYTNGVPKVIQKDASGNIIAHSPYYANDAYKFYFKRMITMVRQHIETLPLSVKNQIIAVQACFGSTGDYIGYKGSVSTQYALTGANFLELFKEFTQHYYNEYTSTNLKISVLSNPGNGGVEQCKWLLTNCPGSWIKTGTIGKGYQLNDEVEKAKWLYNILNTPQNGHYVRARCEIIGDGVVSGWWTKNPYKNMFAMLTYGVYWGLDWSNQSVEQINNHLFDEAFNFYNKYAGQKDPSKSSNAMCALRDGLDAADINRFPVETFGTADRSTARFTKVLSPFTLYGAKLEDPAKAISTESNNLIADGINDVGWKIFPGNYERYLRQINPNATSIGHWNVESVDKNTMFGRFARGFDVANGKNALYFDVDSAFLENRPLDGKYQTMIEITYFDGGTGSWQLFYDSKESNNKPSIAITCKNTQLWKKASVTLNDAYFDNRASYGSDFYIKSTNTQNVIFTLVELTRPKANLSNVGFNALNSISFDTLCVNAVSSPKAFKLSGTFLNGSKIQVGPFPGYKFSMNRNDNFKDSLLIKNYGASFHDTIYVRFNPSASGSYSGSFYIKGGGVARKKVNVRGIAASTPLLSATINNITCNNAKNGSIDLVTKEGAGAITYFWSSTIPFKSFNEDISNLLPADYTVTVNSAGGCKTTATYSITQPEVLTVRLSADSMICKGGTTSLYVNAAGGTQPYTGTGKFIVDAGYKVYYATDANGCVGKGTMTVGNGTLVAPSKPAAMISPDADATGVCGDGNFNYSVDAVAFATSYTWTVPSGTSMAATNIDNSKLTLNASNNFTTGTLAVTANNVCGSSVALQKTLYAIPGRPGAISGPAAVSPSQTGLIYKVPLVAGVSYSWGVPSGAVIVSGQNTSCIKVNWGTKEGNVTVRAVNNCGSSTNISSQYVSLQTNISSNLITSNFINSPTQKSLVVTPNPVKDVASLFYYSEEKEKVSIIISDITGKLLKHYTANAIKGSNTTQVDMHNFINGIYLATLVNSKGQRQTVRIMKQ